MERPLQRIIHNIWNQNVYHNEEWDFLNSWDWEQTVCIDALLKSNRDIHIPYQNKRGKQKGEETLTDVGSL